MRTWRWLVLLTVVVVIGASTVTSARAQDQPKDQAKAWNSAVDKAVAYLKSSQADDGSWSKGTSPGISGLVLTGLLRTGKVTAKEPFVAKALKNLESMVDAKEGHLGAGAKANHRNYITSVNVLALHSAGEKDKYAAVISAAGAYLRKLQYDEKQDKSTKDAYYGGVGYGPGTRPDLSNTHFFLDALRASGAPANDPAFQKVVVFASRCQNLKGEYNDQPWADKINDGSFIYVLGDPKKGGKQDAPKPGYGSMTFAGLKALLMGGVSKDDIRMKMGMEWVAKNYSVTQNPGQGAGQEMKGYYYYLMTMSKYMDLLAVNEFADAAGKKHAWRADITGALAKAQQSNGSWKNSNTGFMEGNADLSTAFALITLSYCREQGK